MTGTYAGEADDAAPRAWPGSRHTSFTVRDFLITAFYHIRVIVLAALVPLLAGLLAASLAKTQYTADSLLMAIVSREVSNSQNVTDSGPSVLSVEGLKQVESEVQIIESADIINQVIESVGREKLFPPGLFSQLRDMFSGSASVMDRDILAFRRNLHVGVVNDSNIIEVSYTHPIRAIAVETTNRLVEIYLARRRDIMQNPTSRFLLQEVDRFSRELKDTDGAIEALKARAGIVDFAQDAVLASNQVDTIVQRRRQLAERKVAVASQIAEAERQLKELPGTIFDFNQRADALDNDDDHNTLSRLLVERDRISMQYAPNGSMMREINRKIDTIRQQIAARKDRAYDTTRDVRNPSVVYVNNMLLNLRVEADAIDRQDQELVQQQADAEKRLAELRTAETQLVELNRRRDTLSDGYREYLRRATAAQIEEAAASERQSNVRLVQNADASVTSRSMRLPYLGAGVLGGLLFGVAAGAVASALRSNFIVPQEVERALELPMLGEFASQTRPDAVEHDVGNLTALLLDTEVDGRPVRNLQFISAEPDEALVRLAGGIATEITTHRGLRTLLVDLTSPAVPPPGGDAAAREKGGLVVAPGETPLLWRLVDSAASPLLDIRLPLAETTRLMQELRGEFEAVVVCATARDAGALSHRFDQLVDGNVLVIRSERTRKAAAVALHDEVVDSGGVPLGFVLVGRRYVLPEWLYRLT